MTTELILFIVFALAAVAWGFAATKAYKNRERGAWIVTAAVLCVYEAGLAVIYATRAFA